MPLNEKQIQLIIKSIDEIGLKNLHEALKYSTDLILYKSLEGTEDNLDFDRELLKRVVQFAREIEPDPAPKSAELTLKTDGQNL